jgi:hypothetical protein
MRKQILVYAGAIILILTLAAIAFAAENPFVGTWKMNPAKSKFGNLSLKSYTITQDTNDKVVQDMVDGNGNKIHRTWAAKYDGKDYPMAAPDADTISFKKPDADTLEYVVKKGGKKAWSGRVILSKDKKTYTDAGSGQGEKGQTYTYSIFMEKQ